MDTSSKDAIAKYDDDVKSGRITFDAEGFAQQYPGEVEADAELREFIASHVTD